jgi:hypothetical protein
MRDDNLEQIQGDLDMQVLTQWQIEDHLRNIRNNQAANSPALSDARPRKIGRLGGKEVKNEGFFGG